MRRDRTLAPDNVVRLSKSFAAVAFDFDGVLVDSQPAHWQAWVEVLGRAYPEIQLSPDLIVGVTANQFLHRIGVPEHKWSMLATAKERTVAQEPFSLFPDAEDLLIAANARYRLALVSSCEPAIVRRTLERHKLSEFFDVVVLAGDYGRPKPDPEPYLIAVRQLQLEPSNVVAIEDSRDGIASARAAGLSTIAVTTSVPATALQDADIIVDCLREAREVLRLPPGTRGA